jgi:spermidine synthase
VTWVDEQLYVGPRDLGYTQRFRADTVICRHQSAFQELIVFDTCGFGRVLMLDGVVQATERDEFIYHEMMTHVPLFAHGGAKRVLVIGGGDGGILREALRHPIEQVTMVELDPDVVAVCREHMPSLSKGAFDDPRTRLLFTDGVKFMAESSESFDVIIVDSTDPIGPGEVLFTESFYADCRRRLTFGGVLVTQNGVPLLQPEETTTTSRRLGRVFADSGFYVAAIPTYIGGFMAMAWASDNPALRQLGADVLARRFKAADFETRYYTPALHVASFALPAYIERLLT